MFGFSFKVRIRVALFCPLRVSDFKHEHFFEDASLFARFHFLGYRTPIFRPSSSVAAGETEVLISR